MGADPYAPMAHILPVADVFLAVLMRRARRGIIDTFQKAGCRRVLDACCGRGALLRRLENSGIKAYGADLSPTMLTGARGRRLPVARADSTRLPYPDGAFDGAVVTVALHEMDPPVRSAVFAEMRRVVRTGGLVVVADFAIPVRPGISGRICQAMMRRDERNIGKLHPPHWINYQSFMAAGGTKEWLAGEGVVPASIQPFLWGNLALAACPV